MDKINILCIPSDTHGVGSFRFIEPHIELQKQNKDEFYVDINPSPNWDDKEYINKFNIIFGHKNMLPIEKARIMIPALQREGIKVIMDVDDHWDISPKSPQYQMAKQIKHSEVTIEYFSLVDYVTTTTEYFADQIRKHTKNVLVFPNAIDPTAKKYQINTEKSDKVRLGWLGGSTHYDDIKLLKPMFTSIIDKYGDKIQSVLCGFDTRGKMLDRDVHGNNFERNLNIEETPWYHYEKFLTSDFKNVSPEYKDFLTKYKKEDYNDVEKEGYIRVWTKPFTTYSLNYNKFDISLIPLVNNKFNLSKSQLKVIEAGFFKKPIIASDVVPYQIDIKHGENGFLVKEGSNKNWAYYAKQLIDSADLRKEMGERLYESVKDKYDLRNVSKARAEWYKSLINE